MVITKKISIYGKGLLFLNNRGCDFVSEVRTFLNLAVICVRLFVLECTIPVKGNLTIKYGITVVAFFCSKPVRVMGVNLATIQRASF